ncbi:hypothetical protein [Rheinheimera sp.]|uniref:hypothetical protein n=1 Tax=Rheinheimera sp. TaxID=1869214 RepID=UPI004048CD3F
MNISKAELLDLLFEYTNGDEIAGQRVAKAYKNKNLFWSQDEWVYVKDIEAAFRAMKKIQDNEGFEQFSHIREIILGSAPFDGISDNWLRNRVLDCKRNLDTLYSQ